uniref:Secreted protein n=1 Tax=Panagrellus redivivus TaxID=6233 RepID=A0A7E4VVH0_PANRE
MMTMMTVMTMSIPHTSGMDAPVFDVWNLQAMPHFISKASVHVFSIHHQYVNRVGVCAQPLLFSQCFASGHTASLPCKPERPSPGGNRNHHRTRLHNDGPGTHGKEAALLRPMNKYVCACVRSPSKLTPRG